MPPRATVRLQLHRDFPFAAAQARVDYFARLGISHLYLSPILAARAGSQHGYDVIDHGRVNPELGGEESLRRLVDALRARGLSLIVDIVPNHMAVGGADNAWWLDLLERGRASRYAAFFDIDWEVPDPALRGRIAAPFLGRPYGEALAAGEIELRFDAAAQKFHAQYFEHRLPLSPRSNALLLEAAGGEPQRVLDAHNAAAGRARLHALLESQHWRLAWWRTAADEINWRRFFDIIGLAALRVEEPRVFEAVHATVLRLYAEGLIDGLRVDHIDGLADPRAYCRRLRARLDALRKQRPEGVPRGPAYLIVEKILAPAERLPRDWRVDGTSGYAFMNDVGALLHDPAGEVPLTRLWTQLTGRSGEFEVEERRARRRIADELLVCDFNATVRSLHRIARSEPATRDVTAAAIRRVLMEILVQMPVYRLYADAGGRSAADAQLMSQVCEAARRACRPGERYLVDLLDRWLGGEPPKRLPARAAQKLRLKAIARFQQLCAPLAAKAVEDTAFYRHGRLLSRNEVGADPAQFALSTADFHAECERRLQRFPDTLLATATHDHKRGEDVRARLAVLSEVPQRWEETVRAWTERNAPLKLGVDQAPAPTAADEYMLYQMLVGAWPLEISPEDAAGLRRLAARIGAWQQKALREAKLRSEWTEPNLPYEDACRGFTLALLEPARSAEFLHGLAQFVSELAPAAALNGLAQTLLRLTTPGVPDLYQGAEFWDLSLVDPDNRRPVDFDAREAALRSQNEPEALLEDWPSGHLKQRLIRRALAFRQRHPALFARGAYVPLEAQGAGADHVIAFARERDADCALILAPRLCATLAEGKPFVPPARWGDTRLSLPNALRGVPLHEALTDRRVPASEALSLREVLRPWSLALLEVLRPWSLALLARADGRQNEA